MNDKELQEIVVHVAEIFKTFYSTHLYEICSKMAEAKQRSEQMKQKIYKLMTVISEKLFVITEILNKDFYGNKNDAKAFEKNRNKNRTTFE